MPIFEPEIDNKQNELKREFNSVRSCNCKATILVVDDSPFNLDIQTELIQDYLNECLGIENGLDFIHQANDGTIAVDLVKKCL